MSEIVQLRHPEEMKGGWENQHKLQESTSASFLNGCLVLSFSVQLCIFRQGHSKLPYHWMRGFPLVLFVYLVFFSQDLLIREKKHNFLCFCVSSSWTLHSWYTLWVSLCLLYAYVSVSPTLVSLYPQTWTILALLTQMWTCIVMLSYGVQ